MCKSVSSGWETGSICEPACRTEKFNSYIKRKIDIDNVIKCLQKIKNYQHFAEKSSEINNLNHQNGSNDSHSTHSALQTPKSLHI
ncbi:hypothetical protein BpHYR1_011687 [Brachionus plicatilis]|uniref:Uncharacterized protein n=1 Tax=Brachionus plicatilis TaxID=10195 RepID=A0A3M7REP1_BRAPC|nr:hypothetical protein BpHYR1_011687 [Brachionus plicatilis]